MDKRLDQYHCAAILEVVIPVQQVVASAIGQQTLAAYRIGF